MISIIADSLVEICRNLDWQDKEELYKKVSDKYSVFIDEAEVEDEEDRKIYEYIHKVQVGDSTGALAALEDILALKRETLGEDSPEYQDEKRSLWKVYAKDGQGEQALHYLSEALVFIEKVYGANSMEMADELSSAVDSLVQICDYEIGEKFSKKFFNLVASANSGSFGETHCKSGIA